MRLWLLDGKLVELSVWAPCAQRLAGPDVDEAIELLRELREEMEARYRELLARGKRKVAREDGLPLHLVVCDELAFYLGSEDRKKQREFAELLRDLVARGRAAGVIVCAATQKPASDVVPSALRDLFGFRLALRCNTPQASDTILGQGWATLGHNAATIAPGQRGVGLLLAEDGTPVRMRGFHLTDSDVDELATRAAAARADGWLASEGGGVVSGPRDIIDALGRGGAAAGIIDHLAEHGPSSAARHQRCVRDHAAGRSRAADRAAGRRRRRSRRPGVSVDGRRADAPLLPRPGRAALRRALARRARRAGRAGEPRCRVRADGGREDAMNRDRRTDPRRSAYRLRVPATSGRGRGPAGSLDPADIAPWVIASARVWPRGADDGLVAARIGVQPQHVRLARRTWP